MESNGLACYQNQKYSGTSDILMISYQKVRAFQLFHGNTVARIGWLPVNNPEKNQTLHIAANLRYAKPLDGKMTLKSRPESNNTPQLINTGSFETDHSNHIGAEAYYTNRRFAIGSEVVTHNFYSDKGDDHNFTGGNVMIAYSITGGMRPYKTVRKHLWIYACQKIRI